MILVADNLNPLNPVVAQALERLEPEPVRQIVRRCEAAGARLLDLNPGYLSRRREDRMTFLVETVQEATSLRLVLDSPKARVLARGLAVCRETPILNALTLEPEKLGEILPLAVEHRTPLVLLLLDEASRPAATHEERIALAVEMGSRALEAGLPLEDLIFDPVMPHLSWQDGFKQAGEAVATVRFLAAGTVFQEPVQALAGLSNLRSGLRRQQPFAVEEACLHLLAGAGLRYLMADALNPRVVDAYRLATRMMREALP